MAGSPYFVKSTKPAFETSLCYDCGNSLGGCDDGTWYLNTNRKAKIKRICGECYRAREKKREERTMAFKDMQQKPKQTVSNDTTVLTIEEAATYLRCSVSFIRKRVAQGDIPHHRLGYDLRFVACELLNWLTTPKA